MGNIMNIRDGERALTNDGDDDLVSLSNGLIQDARSFVSEKQTMSMPIGELASLGGGVASLLPSLRTVTQTTTVHTQGFFRLVNAETGDALKTAKNGNFWGAMKTAEGKSKFTQWQEAGPLSAESITKLPVNPAVMMTAVALFSIEQKLGDIEALQQEILSFLEIEKQSEIEADVQTLGSLIMQYKFNWDNERFAASSHKMVLDIQRTARKHMNAYQKRVDSFATRMEDWACLGQHKRQPEFPDVTRESRRNSGIIFLKFPVFYLGGINKLSDMNSKVLIV